jgi:hypothetical protein
MRRYVASFAIAFVIAVGAVAFAGDDDAVDVSEFREHMVVLTDGDGHYLITAPVSKHYSWAFVGDGKKFYKMRGFGGGLQAGTSYSYRFWSPRFSNRASIEWRNKKWTVSCGQREVEVSVVPDDEAKKMIAEATFHEPLWKRSAYRLARDDRGTYFYIDRARDDYGGRDWHVYKGQKGNLKKLKMKNIVHDSEGDIFSMKKNKKRLIVDNETAVWIDGKKRTELVFLPLLPNLELIYAELGVYVDELGTPCDDFQ